MAEPRTNFYLPEDCGKKLARINEIKEISMENTNERLAIKHQAADLLQSLQQHLDKNQRVFPQEKEIQSILSANKESFDFSGVQKMKLQSAEELGFCYGTATGEGRRNSNEDTEYIENGLLCIFDGHGGTESAEQAKQYANLLQCERCDDPVISLKLNTVTLDELICKQCNSSGCTAGVLFFLNDQAIFGNLGDVRIVTPTLSTDDEKPITDKESVEKYGGKVYGTRVNGVLSTSRALGDRELKTCGVIPKIEVRKAPIEQYYILACDGLWDVMSSELARGCMRISSEQLPEKEYQVKYRPNTEDETPISKNEDRNADICEAFEYYFCNREQEGDNILRQVKGIELYEINESIVPFIKDGDNYETRLAKAFIMTAYRLGSQDNISCIVLSRKEELDIRDTVNEIASQSHSDQHE